MADSSSDSKHLEVRDARDRMIDLLGLGETYPLRDVTVSEELKVPFNKSATVRVAPTQQGVGYQLRDVNGDGPADALDSPLTRAVDGERVPIAAQGSGAAIELTTPAIVLDRAFRVLAQKLHPRPNGRVSRRDAYLSRETVVKVGLDTGLPARVVLSSTTELLSASAARDEDARIIDFGRGVAVDIVGAQEGVDYQLVVPGADPRDETLDTVLSVEEVRGLGEQVTIQLQSVALREDTELRIRATKKYSLSEGRQTERELLEIVMPVKVRANQALGVAIKGSPLIPYNRGATVVIAETQESASYQLFIRRIRDLEFLRLPSALASAPHITVATEGEGAEVAIRRPPPRLRWRRPSGYALVGKAKPGTGGAIEFALPPMTADMMVIARASKQHGSDNKTRSHVPLEQVRAVLVRPNPEPGLALEMTMQPDGAATDGRVRVTGGQAGVLYQLRTSAGGDDVGRPFYVHGVDEARPEENAGVSQLVVGVNFAIARDPASGGSGSDRATTRPERVEVETGPLASGATLHVLARKATTGLSAMLTKTASLAPLPEIRSASVGVTRGQVATIQVVKSQPGSRYHLELDGARVGEARDGEEGRTLELVSAPVGVDSVFEVHVHPIAPAGIGLCRIVPVVVPLAPDMTLAARILGPRLEPDAEAFADADPKILYYGESVDVQVDNAEPDVRYTLERELDGERVVVSAAPVMGDDRGVTLRTVAAREDMDVRVVATRLYSHPLTGAINPTRQLDIALPLMVRADREVGVVVGPRPAARFGEDGSVTVNASQESAFYILFARPLTDADFVYEETEAPTLTVSNGSGGAARVLRPAERVLWKRPGGFTKVGELVRGTGGQIKLPIPGVADDYVLVVQAGKEHRVGERVVYSRVMLARAGLLLVTPQTDPALTLRTGVAAGKSAPDITFLGGQPGTSYQLLRGEAPLGRPVYIHQRDPQDGQQNKGIAGLRVGVDLVVARAREAPLRERDQLVAAAPAHPQTDAGALDVGARLELHATRQRTGVTVGLDRGATIAAVPEISAVAGSVAAGEKAVIRVAKSVAGERYQLTAAGRAVGPARDGDGDELLLESEALDVATRFEVIVSSAAEGELTVERVVGVDVAVAAEGG